MEVRISREFVLKSIGRSFKKDMHNLGDGGGNL